LTNLQETGSLGCLTGSGRACTSHSYDNISAVEELTQSQESKSHTHIVTYLSTRWTFWTYFVTTNLFYLYLMIFVFHSVLNAAGELVLRLHYKSMKCDVSFSQGSVSTIFRWGERFSIM